MSKCQRFLWQLTQVDADETGASGASINHENTNIVNDIKIQAMTTD